MRLAEDFRSEARDALSGKWKIAVLVGLVAILLGAVEGMEPELKVNIDLSRVNASLTFMGQTILSIRDGINSRIGALLVRSFTSIILVRSFTSIIILVLGAVYLVLGSVVAVGYAKFNLNLVDCEDGSFEELFAYFAYWQRAVAARLLRSIYVLLWSLLFIIPGVMASYSYAMTEYILADHPELSASEAISRSKQMMEGNRWRLFCLQFSFIGWSILCSFTFGIGNLWLTPYKKAATAVFYREVSGTEYGAYQNEWIDYTSQMHEEI